MQTLIKKFRSPTCTPIRVALTSGHVAIIPQEGVELGELFWKEAYKEGALSGDMEDLSAILKEEQTKKEIFDKEAKEKQELTSFLEEIFSDPRSFLDKDNKPMVRRISAALGRKVDRKEMLDLWDSISNNEGE